MTSTASHHDVADLDAFTPHLSVWRDALHELYFAVPAHHQLRSAASLLLERAMREHAPEQLETYHRLRARFPIGRVFDYARLRDMVLMGAFVARHVTPRGTLVESMNTLVEQSVEPLLATPLYAPMVMAADGDLHALCQMFCRSGGSFYNHGVIYYDAVGPREGVITYEGFSPAALRCFQQGFYTGLLRAFGMTPAVRLEDIGHDRLDIFLKWT